MNRPLTALFAALEALLVVGIGIGIPLVPLTIMWAAQYGLQIDWLVFWRASVDIWLLGSGVDVRMTLEGSLATAAGFVGAAEPFVLTIAPLGFALLTALLGVRAGRRVAETPHRIFGALVSVGTFAVLALGATLSALHPLARPSIAQGTLLPTLVFSIGVGIGSELTRRRLPAGLPGFVAGRADATGSLPTARTALESARRRLNAWVQGFPSGLRTGVPAALRGGAMAAAGTVAVASLLVAGALLISYADIIALYEGVHAGVLGGVALTLGQVAILPNLVVWATAWLVGPGFAIGAGSAVSPLGTNLGPLPAVPVLGALPAGDLGYGFLGLLVPVLAGFLAAVVIRSRLSLPDGPGPTRPLALGAGIGIVGGILLGLLAWASTGAAGPGRLSIVGPDPLAVGCFAALEIGLAAVAGSFAARPRAAA
jgi:hypothetical protein